MNGGEFVDAEEVDTSMMFKKVICLAVVCVGIVLPGRSVRGAALDSAWFKIETDRSPLAYKKGETIAFTVTLQDVGGDIEKGRYFLKWRRSGDDGNTETGRVALTASPFVYSTKMDCPGFVRLEGKIVDCDGREYIRHFDDDALSPEGKPVMNRYERGQNTVFFDGGAGVDVAALAAQSEPADFNEFWDRQFARLDVVPFRTVRIPVANTNDDYRIEAVRVDCAGLRPVYGYIIFPPDAGVRKYPLRLQFFGYDRNARLHNPPPGHYRDNEIVFEVNAYGMKLPAFGATEADRKAFLWEIESNGFGYALDPRQNVDPEMAFFNGMVLRVKRAAQYAKTLPAWNGRDIIASGGSQGGLQAIWAAACGEGVTCAESYITWCCDLGGERQSRNRGNWFVGWADGLGYYDAVNFAKRIPATCFVDILRAGLGDYTSPPSGIAILYNVLRCPKRIKWIQGSQHGYVPPYYDGRDIVFRGGMNGSCD